MKKLDFFLEGLNNNLFRQKDWVIHCFSKTNVSEIKGTDVKMFLLPGDKTYSFTNMEGQVIELEDTNVNDAPFSFREVISLKKGDVINLNEDIETNYGKLLINAIMLIYPLGNKVSYINNNLSVATIESIISKRLVTDEQYQTDKSKKIENPIYVSEYLKFIDAALYMEGFSQLAVPSATQKTMTADPRISKRRAELIGQYKDTLDDPATVAKIDAELIKMDKEWIKGDLGEGFYSKAKSFDVVRKKMHLMVGYEGGLGVDPDTIISSLSEGWDLTKLPSMVNSLREGSYYRGKMTAEGGYATKTINRLFQNVVLDGDDCGSTLGWETNITDSNKESYIGFYYLDKDKPVEITEDNVSKLIGKSPIIRTPMFCKAPGTSFCKTCMGNANSTNEHGLGALASEMTSLFLNTAMKKMHGTSLKVKDYDPSIALS